MNLCFCEIEDKKTKVKCLLALVPLFWWWFFIKKNIFFLKLLFCYKKNVSIDLFFKIFFFEFIFFKFTFTEFHSFIYFFIFFYFWYKPIEHLVISHFFYSILFHLLLSLRFLVLFCSLIWLMIKFGGEIECESKWKRKNVSFTFWVGS